jgi:hypothetical protein
MREPQTAPSTTQSTPQSVASRTVLYPQTAPSVTVSYPQTATSVTHCATSRPATMGISMLARPSRATPVPSMRPRRSMREIGVTNTPFTYRPSVVSSAWASAERSMPSMTR